mmetsp:Transcript_10632/g.14678  ORF Transcript_10632/g.14678 Transcript_10632/m.14678 type:complete len:375 (+) Transcript_10632:211-1335(+)
MPKGHGREVNYIYECVSPAPQSPSVALPWPLALRVGPIPRREVLELALERLSFATADLHPHVLRLLDRLARPVGGQDDVDHAGRSDGVLALDELLKLVAAVLAVAKAVGDAEARRGVREDGQIARGGREALLKHLGSSLHPGVVERVVLRRLDGDAAIAQVPQLVGFLDLADCLAGIVDVELTERTLGLVRLRDLVLDMELLTRGLRKRQRGLQRPGEGRDDDVLDAACLLALQPLRRVARLADATGRERRVVAHQLLVKAELSIRCGALGVAAVLVPVPDYVHMLLITECARKEGRLLAALASEGYEAGSAQERSGSGGGGGDQCQTPLPRLERGPRLSFQVVRDARYLTECRSGHWALQPPKGLEVQSDSRV